MYGNEIYVKIYHITNDLITASVHDLRFYAMMIC